MDRLVHERAATFALPRATPGVPSEIGAVSTKKRDAFGDGDATDAAIDDRRMHALCGWKKTALEHAPELHVICAGGLKQLVRLLKGNGDRLLDDRVDAPPPGRNAVCGRWRS